MIEVAGGILIAIATVVLFMTFLPVIILFIATALIGLMLAIVSDILGGYFPSYADWIDLTAIGLGAVVFLIGTYNVEKMYRN